MNEFSDGTIPRGKIAMRLLLTVLCLILLSAVHFVIQVTALIQYALLLITKRHSEPLRGFSNKAAAYAYRLIRYIPLNENTRPFPFTDFPPELEPSELPVKFD